MSTLVPGQCLACDQPASSTLNVNVGGVRASYPSCPQHLGMLSARMVNDTRKALAKLGHREHDPTIIDAESREVGILDT